jgi:hypothetical protein
MCVPGSEMLALGEAIGVEGRPPAGLTAAVRLSGPLSDGS